MRPSIYAAALTFVGPGERIAHIIELLPEIGSLDCGSLNFDEALYGTTPDTCVTWAREYRRTGVRPEIEVFELGTSSFARQLIAEGLIDAPALFQLCLGLRTAAPPYRLARCETSAETELEQGGRIDKAFRDELPASSMCRAEDFDLGGARPVLRYSEP